MASTWIFLISINLFAGALALSPPSNGEEMHICYDDPECGPSTWGGMCQSGKEQSPIDIPLHPGFFEPVKFIGNRKYFRSNRKFYGKNTGHTVHFSLSPDLDNLKSDLVISGGKLPAKYTFAQLHFHWGRNDSEGSEHTVNGESHPLEIHMVHYKSDYESLNEAVKSTDDRTALAVMGVFFKIGRKNNRLTPIIQTLKYLREAGEIQEFNTKLKISDFYPKISEFARYKGSLTTPSCDEKVLWSVFTHPLTISDAQMKEFRELENGEGHKSFNYRPTQPLHSRKINYYTEIKLKQ